MDMFWEIYYWIYIYIYTVTTFKYTEFYIGYPIYIYWIWEYTDDILLMLVIQKLLDILMIYYSYWDILLDIVY